MNLRLLLAGSTGLGLVACGQTTTAPDAGTPASEPSTLSETGDETDTASEASETSGPLAGVASATYSLDPTHAFLTFKVPHGGGISQYRVSFTDFDADLTLDAEAPEASALTVTINPASVETNYPGDYKQGHPDSAYASWNEDLSMNPQWLNAGAYPEISFTSTAINRTSDTAGTVTGDLTFLGQTRPVTLDVTFNGATNSPFYGERDLIGFDASTTITRSEWGMGAYLPMIGDEVMVTFSGEFLQDE